MWSTRLEQIKLSHADMSSIVLINAALCHQSLCTLNILIFFRVKKLCGIKNVFSDFKVASIVQGIVAQKSTLRERKNMLFVPQNIPLVKSKLVQIH